MKIGPKSRHAPVMAALLAAGTSTAQQLEEITVTAQRRAQSLQDVAVSVSAFAAEDLTALKLDRAQELAAQTPGLSVKPQFGNEAPVFTMRAIGTNDPSTINSPTVSVYVDEVLIPYHMMLGFQLFDMERTEVLKGPQGTLYGRNNTGGAVNFITRRPSAEPNARVRIDYGSFKTLDVEAAAGGGLTDNLAGRVAVLTKQQMKGFQRNRLFPDTDANGELDQVAVRGMLEWQATEDVTVWLRLSGGRHDDDQWFYEHQGTQDPAFAFGAPPAFLCAPAMGGRRAEGQCTNFFGYFDPDDDAYAGDYNNAWDDDGDGKTKSKFSTWGSSLRIDWELPRFMLTALTGYERFSRDATEDTDMSPVVALEGGFFEDIWAVSQELRLTSDESWAFDWIAGLYYYRDNGHGSVVFLTRDLLGTNFDHKYDHDVEAIAGFVHLSWPFAEQWRLNGGMRVTHETRDMTQRVTDLNSFGTSFFNQPASFCTAFIPFLLGVPGTPCAAFGPTPPVFGQTIQVDVDDAEIDVTDVSGEIGVDWSPQDDLLLYAKFSKGFKSGGFNSLVVFFPPDAAPYKEEDVYAWEGGMKSQFLDDTLRVNAAVFYMEWKDFQAQISQPGGAFPVDNAGDAEILGAELELDWYPLEGLNVRNGVSWLDTEIVKTNPDLVDQFGAPLSLDGNRLHDAPKFEVNGLIRYSHPLPFLGLVGTAQVDYYWTDEFFYEVKNVPPASQEDYFLLNARLSVTGADDRWEFAVWGRNLLEKTYSTENFDFTGTTGSTVRVAGYPREVGVSVSYRWD